MKIVKGHPPNFNEIKAALGETPDAIYCYGDTIYNPTGAELPADLLYHEGIHEIQQKDYVSPEVWWKKYLLDEEFRKDQEGEAYAHQYRFIKKHASNRIAKDALFHFANILASAQYQLNMTYFETDRLIRGKAKKIV